MGYKEAIFTFCYLLPASISVLYIIGMGARFYDLRSNIQAELLSYNYSIILRITLLTFDITAEFIQFLLVILYSDDKQDYISGVLFVNISAIIMQINLMCYEYKKRVPMFFAHKIYWIFNWLFLCISFVLLIYYVQIQLMQQGKIVQYSITLFRIIDYTVLLIFTLFIRQQDLSEFQQLGFWKSELPMVDLKDSQRPRMSTIANPNSLFIKIELKKRWNIVDGDVEVKIDVTIIGGDKQYKLKKTVTEIFQFHQQFVFENADYFDQHQNDLLQLNFLVKQMQESQDQQLISYVQRYLNMLSSKLDFITQSFMDFIQLQTQERMLVDELKQVHNVQNLHKSSMIVRKNQTLKKQKWDMQSQYLPYMDVRITEYCTIRSGGESYVQYTLITQFQDETMLVQKRFKEFYEFSEIIKTDIKNLPPFPQKTIIKMTNEELEERKNELEIFMRVLLNDRLFHQSILFRFIGMSQLIEEQVKILQQRIIKEGEMFLKLSIKNTGYEEAIGKDGEKYIRYSFLIGFHDEKHTIWKRFSQFDELHSLLKQRYTQLPQLPYKTTAALQQISPNLRSVNLQQYLQDLVKVPTIGENGHLRQFLEIRNIQIDDFDNNSYSSTQQYGSYSQLDSILQKLDNNNKDIEQLDIMRSRLWQ